MICKKFVIFIFIGSLITGIILLYFLRIATNQEIVVLLADESPIKVKPRDPGGLIIPYSDSLVYEKLNTNRASSNKVYILPPPEAPIEIIRNVKQHEVKFLDSIDDILSNLDYNENYLPKKALPDNHSSDYIILNKLSGKEELILFDEIVVVPNTKLKVMKAMENRYKTMRVNTVYDEDKGYKIQLSSAHSSADAEKEWKKIQQKYSKILQDANLIIKKVDGQNDRKFYLVMAGSYPSLSNAKMICKKLSFRKQNCIVIK